MKPHHAGPDQQEKPNPVLLAVCKVLPLIQRNSAATLGCCNRLAILAVCHPVIKNLAGIY